MKRRIFSLLLAFMFVFSLALAEGTNHSAQELENAQGNDIIPHRLIGEDLAQDLTTGELAALMVRLFEAFWQTQEIPVRTPYASVVGHPLQSEIEKAYGLGFLPDLTDGPDSPVNRAQAAQSLCTVLKSWLYDDWTPENDSGYRLCGPITSRFLDDGDISSEAMDSVYFLSSGGLMDSIGDQQFAPLAKISRADAIITANRIYLMYMDTSAYEE